MNNPVQPDFILFLHLQKTAGMTLQELLRRQYGPGFARRALNRLMRKSPEGLTMKDALRALSPTDRLFMGHFCFGVHRFLLFDVTYITFLRDPVARLISLYNYSANTPGAHYYKVAKDMSCEEFLFESKLLEMDNGMTRFIAGDSDDLFINRTQYGQCGRDMLDQALSNLHKHFSFVGIQEDFDRSVLLLSKILKWRNPHYISLNKSDKSPANASHDEDLKARIREANPLDMELYSICRQRFEDEFNAAFKDAGSALELFRKKNEQYQQYARPLYNARTACGRFGKAALKLIKS